MNEKINKLTLDRELPLTYGIVLRGTVNSLDRLLKIINDNLGTVSIVHAEPSAGKLWITSKPPNGNGGGG